MDLLRAVPVLVIAALTISMQLPTSCDRPVGMAPYVDVTKFAPATAPAGAEKASPLADLDILSYNVFLRPNPVSWGDANACRAREIADALVERAKSLDLVALNESFQETTVHRLVEKLGDHFPYRALQKPEGGWLQINGGISLLSKYPIRKLYSKTFDNCAFDDCLASKGFVHAVIELSESFQFNVLATHLDAGNSSWDLETRRAQLETIREYLNGRKDLRDWPTIVLGDLNVDGIRGSVGRYAERDMSENEYGAMMARLTPNCSECSGSTCPESCPTRPLDAMASGVAPWRFDHSETAAINTINCLDQSMDPCRSPNERANWERRQRLDYILTLPARTDDRRELSVADAEHIPFENDACSTTYLSDHQAIRATLEVPSFATASAGD